MTKRALTMIGLAILLVGGAVAVWIVSRAPSDQGQAGGSCGGIAGIGCPEGYRCYYSVNASPDAMGQCIPQYVDESRTTNATGDEATTANWQEYTNATYHFSVRYPADWTASELAATETHFSPPSGQSVKFTVFDYSEAPATAAEATSPTLSKAEITAQKQRLATSAPVKTINGVPVYFRVVYDQSGAVFVRQAEFFVGEDYVRFSRPVLDNLLLDGKFVVDPAAQSQVDEMILQIERGQAGSDAIERIKAFDEILLTLKVQA